jgi:hypothetical protein
MRSNSEASGTAGRLVLVAILTICTTAALVVFPIGYSQFSWEALGQPYTEGSECTQSIECISLNCVDNFCCDTECDGTGEACNVLGSEGTCTLTAAMAPALSTGGYVVIVLALMFGGWFGLYSRRLE